MYSAVEFSNMVKNIDKLYDALQKDPNLIHAQDEFGMTLLHHAAVKYSSKSSQSDVTDNIAIILEHNCNPDNLNRLGAPALTYALISNLPHSFLKSHYLLDKGANPLAGIKGQRPIDQISTMRALNAPEQLINPLIDKIYTKSLLVVLLFYRKIRQQDSRNYFNLYSLLGGYSRLDKLNAVDTLIAAIQEKFSVSDDVLTICRQGRLGQLIAQWERVAGITISEVVNDFSNAFTPQCV